MNDFTDLKNIPIADFLQRLGHSPASRRGHEWMYFAPYRQEKTPSFRVNTEKNVFFDFGTGTGGDIFTLAGEIIGSSDFKAQAKFIADNLNVQLPMKPYPIYRSTTTEPRFEDVEVRELSNVFLLQYLRSRGISPEVAKAHCDEIHYRLNGKDYYGIGFRNVAGGFEVRNKFAKLSIPPKEVSLIAGDKTCNVYEGFFDFLSAVQFDWQKENSAIVLNSTANVHKAFRYLDGYDTIVCFLDNDEAGRKAFSQIAERYPDRVVDRSGLYAKFNDLNDYLKSTLKPSLKPRFK